MQDTRTLRILLVEDNAADAELTADVLESAELPIELRHVSTAAAATAALHGETRPDIILLDLGLPDGSGKELLKVVKTDKTLATIPVIVLTSSDSLDDVAQAYDYGANCYLTKPGKLAEFDALVKSIGEFWMRIVELPRV